MAGPGADPATMSYASLRANMMDLRTAPAPGRRVVLWIDDQRTLGVARDQFGRIEIFMVGAAISTKSLTISANMSHDTWRSANEDAIVANRLLLPAATHFDSIAAFLCVEMISNGIVQDLEAGFRRSEAVIEIAIERSRLQGGALLGLWGELLVMTALADSAPQAQLPTIVDSWHGHVRSSRDFQLRAVGLEVKTTQGTLSSHKVQGVRQVEIGHSVGGAIETSFFLSSIGAEPAAEADVGVNTWSLPDLVEGLRERIFSSGLESRAAEELTDSLLTKIRAYGTGEGEGYDHEEMMDRAAFRLPWRLAFARTYDMSDKAITVLRTRDLVPFAMVDADSVEFEVTLPTRIDGDVNPIVGLRRSATVLLDLW